VISLHCSKAWKRPARSASVADRPNRRRSASHPNRVVRTSRASAEPDQSARATAREHASNSRHKASTAQLAKATISANAATDTVLFTVPAATLGHPGPGWAAVVTLTGEDGFSPDQARGFTSTPGPFTFGVCAAPSADSHGTVDPNTVPKIIDTITPSGISQSTELDFTFGPVVLSGVPFPEGGQWALRLGLFPSPAPLRCWLAIRFPLRTRSEAELTASYRV
jgi:hypothetical protein